MPSEKPYRMRVRVIDGSTREYNRLKGQLVPHVDVIDAKDGIEFIICAVREAHLDQVRGKFGAAGLEEVPGGDTSIIPPAPASAEVREDEGKGRRRRQGAPVEAAQSSSEKLSIKPYSFVPLADELITKPPIWHDGTSTDGRLSGEIRCEIETLTPLLVGWERTRIDDTEEPWSVSHTQAHGADVDKFIQDAARQEHRDGAQPQHRVEEARRQYLDRIRGNVIEVAINGVGRTIQSKSVLCPLRAPWGVRPVLLPGDSIKGLLRHELGALLGAPMERVAERSYSYRPNSLFPNDPNPRLVPRLARIAQGAAEMRPLYADDAQGHQVRVPVRLELLPNSLRYDRYHNFDPPRYRFDVPGGAVYRGGQGAGERLNSKRNLHRMLEANPNSPTTAVDVPEPVQTGYLNTLRHLIDLTHGHFSERHPDVPTVISGENARRRILDVASSIVFQPGDIIWVEWDTQKACIVSLGWHYYYRWAYVDTVRKKNWAHDRYGLFPTDQEKTCDEGAPRGLTTVRRLFGYTGDNDGSKGIGMGDHQQLMGRISVNAAIEVILPADTEGTRFLQPTFLKELGRPRPSAVEHYVQQPYYPNRRPSDRAKLVTYGDAAGYDQPGQLAGRKFYLDRTDAYDGEQWKDGSERNRLNDRSTLALEASRCGRRFRFSVRFRDLDAGELAAVLIALAPHQFRAVLGGDHKDGYCSKLGYARPLGWGSVRVEAKELYLLDTSGDAPTLSRMADLAEWVQENYAPTARQQAWLDIHRCKHPYAGDYPSEDGHIYSYHTKLRAEHTRARRYNRETSL